LSTTYWQLTINQVHGSYTRKMDAVKNYKCANHNLFFGIDLYPIDAEPQPSPAPVPHYEDHRPFLEEFFETVL